MAGSPADQVAQRDLLGAGATLARLNGWTVVDLHANKTNPSQVSGPDQLLLRGEEARAHKYLTSGNPSVNQERAFCLYADAGITVHVYRADAGSWERLLAELA